MKVSKSKSGKKSVAKKAKKVVKRKPIKASAFNLNEYLQKNATRQFIVNHGAIAIKFDVILINDIAVHDDDALLLLNPKVAKEVEAKLDIQVANFLKFDDMEHVQTLK